MLKSSYLLIRCRISTLLLMRQWILFVFSTLTFTSCWEADVSKIVVDPAFSSYVSAFTSGMISSKSTVKLVLVEPHPRAKVGMVIEDELFDFEPELEGHAYWLDEQTIEFRPNEKLPSGQSYVCTFMLGELIEVDDKYEEMKFGFIVITQSLFVSFDGLRTLDPRDYRTQELFGTVRTSDVADAQEVERCMKAVQNSNELSLDWEHDEKTKTHKYIIKNVQRFDTKSEVTLSWDAQPIGSETRSDLDIEVPPLKEFSLVQIRTVSTPGLYFSIQFSDPVDSRQDLTGLIRLESGVDLRFSIEGNEVKAFPADRLNVEDIIRIEQSVKNTLGNTLLEGYEREVQLNLELPAVELLGDGVIMPSGGGVSFPFRAVNLKAVNVRVLRIFEQNVPQFLQVNQFDGDNELTRVGRLVYDKPMDLISSDAIDFGVWNNFSIDLSNIVQREPGAIYRVMIGFDRSQALYPCEESNQDSEPMKPAKLNFEDGQDYYWSDYPWFEYEDYDWEERDNPCDNAFYIRHGRGVSANLFASDIGLIAKESAGNQYDVVVTDLNTTEPISEVYVYAYNYQNKQVGEGRTNNDGVVRIECSSKPYLLVANSGDQRGYLRVDNGSALSVSLYEVGGTKVEKGVKGFIYGERGVWRPGDTIHLSFMLEDKLNTIPSSHPVVLEFFDPQGKLYDKKVVNKGVNGLYAFQLNTEQTDMTGNWRAKVSVGNSAFHKTIKVETIKPNRLRFNFEVPEVIAAGSNINLPLNTQWLYGAAGSSLLVRSELTIENMKTEFKGYEDFQFDDRSNSFSFDEPIIAEARTNSAGSASLSFKFSKPNDAPGMLWLKFQSKVFEPGGDFSQDFTSAKYSPYRSYVGLKMDAGTNWMTAIDTEKETAVAIAAVDQFGKPLTKNVQVELYKMNSNWWWESEGNDELTRYISRGSAELISTQTVGVNNGKTNHSISFPEPTWGRFLLRVVDPVSGHSAMQEFFADYEGWYESDGASNEAAAMLNLELGKPVYDVSEKVQVTVPSGGLGRIYVTIEKGDKILDQFWVEASNASTKFSFTATADMAPNVYVNAFLLQPHAQRKNSLPIRMYGVVPVSVNDPSTRLSPLIKTPASLQPEKTFEVKVSEKDGKPMAYTLAVVDEGLLGISRFKTPDPWNAFYTKEALLVHSWDMYKYVMSAQTGKMSSLLAVGGDQGLVYKEEDKANRFKPVVKFLGPFFLDADDVRTHRIKLPNYIGAVRVMVVACYEGAYGSEEKTLEVKQPLMVLATMPRVLGPGEKVRVPVNVIAMDEKVKSVSVKVTADNMLVAAGPVEQSVSFTKPGDQNVFFDFEVPRKLGKTVFKVEATSGKDRAFEEVEVQVRVPNPAITKSTAKAIQPDEVWEMDYQTFGVLGTNKAILQVSRIPDLDLEKQLEYLIQYPYGCIEQTVSSVFPQMYLSSLLELKDDQKANIQKNVTAGLNKLRQFQVSSGGFTYWPGREDQLSMWCTNYAGHFLLEAKNKGYELPAGMLDQWKKFQKEQAASWNRERYAEDGHWGSDFTQAYRLFTLALANSADVGAMNRLRNDEKLSDAGAWRLSAAYALIGREDVANELANRPMTIEPYREQGYTYGSDVRDMAMILETLTYLKDYDQGEALISDIASRLNSGWQSTQTRAFSLLAISKFIGGNDATNKYSFTCEANGKPLALNTNSAVHRIVIDKEHLQKGSVKVTNRSSQLLFVSLIQTGSPVEMNDTRLREGLEMAVVYKDMNNNTINVNELKQGADFKAVVTVKHPGIRGDYQQLALNQIFPSGWQIINSRLNESPEEGSTNYSYQDIRDDRVNTFFDLKRGETKQFEIILNATFAGRFYKPAVFCAPMYDESIRALDPGSWVEVRVGSAPQAYRQ